MSTHALRAALFAAVLAAAVGTPALADDKDPVVASVDGVEIHKSAVVDYYKASPKLSSQFSLDEAYSQILEILTTNQLLLVQAQKASMDKDPDVLKAMKRIQDKIMVQVWLNKKIEPKITDDALKARYAEVLRDLPPPHQEIRAAHILLKSKEAAEQVLADLRKGVKFEDEAKAKTEDSLSKDSGGDLGYFSKDAMLPEFAEAAFKLNPGEVSKTPVKTQFGWHVIKVIDKRDAPPPSFEQIKPDLVDDLFGKGLNEIKADLTRNAQIKKFNIDGTPMDDKPAAAPKP